MSNSYNLDETDNVENPIIIVNGKEYLLEYPTMDDLEKIQDEKDATKQNDIMFSFIKPKEADTPLFKEAIKTKNILALKKIGDIIKTEFGVEEV